MKRHGSLAQLAVEGRGEFGSKTLAMTLRYSHLPPAHKATAVALVTEAVAPGPIASPPPGTRPPPFATDPQRFRHAVCPPGDRLTTAQSGSRRRPRHPGRTAATPARPLCAALLRRRRTLGQHPSQG